MHGRRFGTCGACQLTILLLLGLVAGCPAPPDTTPPTVVSTHPADGATGVAINSAIAVTFNESMDTSTLTTQTFRVTAPGSTPVAGVVTASGRTATFTPSSNLAPNTTYTARVTSAATDLAGNALACEFVWTFSTGEAADTTPPTVISTSPADGATNVPINTAIFATFSEEMDPQTITTETFTVTGPAQTPVAATVTYFGTTATFTPDSNLAAGTIFTATLNTGATDLAGNALAADFVWIFATGEESDTTPPTVSSTNPADGATGVPINQSVTATFSEQMDPSTITAESFTVTGPGLTPVPGTVTYLGTTATFTPDSTFTADTTFTATITTEARDLAGNLLATDFAWSFTTGTTADTIAPTVSSTIPAAGATGVPTNTAIVITLSEEMDPLTITTETFTVTAPGLTPVPGVVAYSGTTATFTPNDVLAADATFTVTLTTDARDLAGNQLASDFVWTFTTGSAADTTAPTVSATIPADGATDVPLNQSIVATFSEDMDPFTISTDTVTVAGPGLTPVAGVVSYIGTTAIFTPASNLAADTTYTATITTGARDLAGNELASDFAWSFTTGTAADTTAPTVISTSPADGATDVPTNITVAVTFSEQMDPFTITPATFMVIDPDLNPVAGTVTYFGTVATFTPDSNLAANTTYTATITTGAGDLSGNALAADFEWSFTTGAGPDTTAPTVSSVNPADGATGIPINRMISATFDEEMDPLTITNETFTVIDPGLTPVAGVVTYLGTTATFTPDSNFAADTTFTAMITTGARDLAGNELASDFTWSFTTGAAEAEMPVDLQSLSTFAVVAGDGLINSNAAGETTINGDVGLSPTATCLGDGVPCTVTNPIINGTLYANDLEGVAAAAQADSTDAYSDAAGRAPGTMVNDLTGLVLPSGVYTSGSTMTIAEGGTLTLDAQGDADAVFIFQVGSSLTVNNNAQVLLVNGANSANVYWAIVSSATIGTDVSFAGTVLAGDSISVDTGSTVDGRLLSRDGQVVLAFNTVTVPDP
jgi:methionine-rich copper-binding protein CopC